MKNYIYNFVVPLLTTMRILKYLLLIVLLFSIGLFVYIFTQKGDYQVSSTQIIKASRITVFDYVNDYKNWETFHAMNQNNEGIVYNYKDKTSGIGGSFSWYSDSGDGFMKTVFVKENDSLSQKITIDGYPGKVNWKFKDTVGGTKVTISSKGKIGFLQKFNSFWDGGINRKMTNEFDRTLYNLNKTIDFELKTYLIKVNGVVPRKAAYFIKQTFSCKTKSISKNIKQIMPKLVYFFKKNNIPMAGKPFVIYDTTTLETDIVTLSICIPTKEKIAVMEGSDVTSGEMEAFTCIKTTLKGDYSHREELWKTAQLYITDKKYSPNFSGKYVEYYTKTIDDVKNPSKWETELYIPVYPKAEDLQVVLEENDTSDASPVTNPEHVTTPKPQNTLPVTVLPKPAATKKPDTVTKPKATVLKKTDTLKKPKALPQKVVTPKNDAEN